MTKGRAIGLGGFGLLLAAGLLSAFYWGWCWGWWLPENLLLQYLFQCQCPGKSEEARYPERVDVLFSACTMPYIASNLSPSGRYMLVSLRGLSRQWYLYDFKTGELKPDVLPVGVYFLTDDLLLWIEHYQNAEKDNYYLYDVTGKRLLQLNRIPMTRQYHVNSADLEVFRAADRIYLISGLAIALAPDFMQHPGSNFVLGRYSETSDALILKLLEEHGIGKAEVTSVLGDRTISHNDLFQYIGSIYLKSNKQLIVRRFRPDDFSAQGWAFEDRGVILSPYTLYVIGQGHNTLFIGPTFLPVPQPILLLKVPTEYLAPEARQVVEARQAHEEAVQAQATMPVLITLAVIVTAVSAGAFWQFRKRRSAQAGQG